MIRRLALAVPTLLAVALSLPGCNEDPVPRPPMIYADPTAPESVLVNLQIAYRRREIRPYAALLAPEFTFKFIPRDAQNLGLPDDTWDRGEDSTGTAALFGTNQVTAIRIELIFAPAVADTESGHPPGSMKIRVAQTSLEVDQTDGLTWLVTEAQDFFFRNGNAAAGEDPTHWFLLEWRDLDLTGAAPRAAPAPEETQEVTWGIMKARYHQ